MNYDEYYLNQNTIFLRKIIPDIEERLEKIDIVSDFKIASSEKGYPILMKNGIALNDKYNPIEENINVFEAVPQSKDNIYIICGLELGHLLTFFRDNSQGQIILFENDLEQMKYTFSKVSLIKVLGCPRVYVATNFDELNKIIAHIKLLSKIEHIYTVANDYYSKIYSNTIAQLQEMYV